MSAAEFHFDYKVRFADVDKAGIVYYPRYFHFFHVTFEEWFEREFGASYPEVLGSDQVGFPAVRNEVDYRAPARYGDVLRIRVTCARLGTKSVTCRYRATRLADGVLCAEALVTTACVDMRAFVSQPTPPRYREFFSRFLES